jgi:hypothetical protein
MTLRKTSGQIATAATGWAILVSVIIGLTGCATPAGKVSNDFTPNDREGVVYGRMELDINGETLPPDYHQGFVNTNVVVHVSRYQGDDQLNSNSWKPGEFAFRAHVSQDGRFAAKLPVGTYYCVEFAYAGVPVGRARLAGWRTYAPILGETLVRPSVITFEVLPNKATYIGHVHHMLQIEHAGRQDHVNFDLRLSDDTAQDTSWLLQQYPNLGGETTSRLVVREPLRAAAQ